MYTIERTLSGEFDAVVESVTGALAEEGFGILCDIDVEATLREKLGEDFRRIVYETDDGEIGVSAVDPEVMLSVVENPALDPIAADVRERLERVLDAVTAELAA